MIEVYADGYTVYNSRLNDYALLGLKVTVALNKGGTAEITMPPGHPAYGEFVNYKTIVEIYRYRDLLFRGRALYPSDDFYNRRTITCEGERCFLKDAVMRPYLYQDDPAAIFADVIGIYNSQVEQSKQFQVGEVTVNDPNDYVRLESETAEQVGDTIDKLVDRCGGYIFFTTNASGQRCINWYAALGYRSTQAIEFGENLLDFSRTQASTDLATRIIPYGAKDAETGERVSIRSVNNGQDFIEDDEAVALRGVIARPVYWDDVTEPTNLLAKAKQYLATSKMVITTLRLSAVDLSVLDVNIDTLEVGGLIPVKSQPHGVDDEFLLTERTYNLLDPSQDTVTMGKDLTTLTGAGVAGDRETIDQLHKTEASIKTDYKIGISQAIQQSEKKLSSVIEQTAETIRLETSENYAKTEVVQKMVDGIAIGGRNLLLDSGTEYSNTLYPTHVYTMSEKMVEGRTYTIRLWGELGEGKQSFRVFLDGGYIMLCDLHDNENGTYSSTFTAKAGTKDVSNIHIYPVSQTVSATSTISKIKLEIGNKATDWTPAPEDTQSDIDGLKETTSNQGQIIQTQESRLSDLEVNTDAITATVQRVESETKTSLDGVEESMKELREQVSLSLTSDQVNIAIEKKLEEGVETVKTSTGFTFDEQGLTVSKSGSEMTTQITEDGMSVSRNNDQVLVANSQGVQATNLHANTYLIISERARLEAYGTDRVACFWIGG